MSKTNFRLSCIFQLVAICSFCALLTSCPGFPFNEDEPKTPREYLERNFPGEFTNARKITNPHNYDDSTYIKYYSSALQKDIVVQKEYFYTNTKKFPSFRSNYFYIKYESKINPLKEYVDKDFSQSFVIYDLDFVFSWDTEKENHISAAEFEKQNKNDFLRTDKYVIINATEQETAELDERLHSLAWRIYDSYKSDTYWYNANSTYFFISTPQSRSSSANSGNPDFSKTNFDNLFEALKQADKTFAYKYKMKDDYCSLSKFTLDDITKEE